MTHERRDHKTYGDGVRVRSLDPVLPSLQLGREYTVLAAMMLPDDPSSTYALVHLHNAEPQPYVLYRVDGRDGSCHGGHYCHDLARGFQVFADKLNYASGQLTRRAVEDEDRRLAGMGLRTGPSADELPAHSPQSEFYSDASEAARAAEPASLRPAPLSSEDLDLLGRVAAFMEDDGSITDGERHELLQDVLARHEEAEGLLTDDEMSPERRAMQTAGSW